MLREAVETGDRRCDDSSLRFTEQRNKWTSQTEQGDGGSLTKQAVSGGEAGRDRGLVGKRGGR